ncbi:MAG: hypothetical protein LBP30_07705 [Clostridiales Family XIII bacterium]|jgi:hypothetical protein|nr:hypothetical protein [Clostridiales Family XIII bacterium]
MYCRVCGNLLEDNDPICKVCGADIKKQRRQIAGEPPFADTAADERAETAFAPPREANAGTEVGERDAAYIETDPCENAAEADSSNACEEDSLGDGENDASPASETETKRESDPTGEFSWNIHRFPNMEARKTEEIDFDWSMSPSALSSSADSDDLCIAEEEENYNPKSIDELFALYGNRESETFEEGANNAFFDAFAAELSAESAKFAALSDGETQAAPEERADLTAPAAQTESGAPAREDGGHFVAAEAFAHSRGSGAETSSRERFFTFDQKNEEFQKLLDREYERLQAYNSPVLNEAREMLAAWDWPGFAGKLTDSATKRWEPLVSKDTAKREAPSDAGAQRETPTEDIAADVSSAPEDIAGAPMPEEAAPEPTEEPALAEDRSAAPEPADAEAPEAPEPADAEPPETPEPADAEAPEAPEPADAEPPEAPEPADAEPPEPADAETPEPADAETPEAPEPADASFEEPAPEPEPTEEPAPAEAELSISKALDSLEKEMEDWKNRKRMSTASKVAVIVSAIFLLFTGGAAAIKHFAPHSAVDAWFDGLQLQAATAIKHGVDAIRDIFGGPNGDDGNSGGPDDETAGS